MVCITAMFALVKLAGEHGASVFETLFFRQLAGVLILIPWALAGPGLGALRTNRKWHHAARAGVGLVAMGLNFWSYTLLPLAEATTIGFMVPIFATLLSILLLSEVVGLPRWSAIVIGFVGILIVIRPGSGHIPSMGVVVALSGVCVTAWVSIIIRKLGATERATTTVFWFSLASMPPLALLMLVYAQPHPPIVWLIFAGIGISGTLAQLGLTTSLRLAPVSIVLPIDYLSLFGATFFGWAIWNDLPGPTTWIGAPLVIGSGLYIVWREHRSQRARRADPAAA